MPSPLLAVVVGSQNWQNRATAALTARRPVRLVLPGADGEGVVKRLARRGIVVPKVGGGSNQGVGVAGGVLRVVTIEYLVLGTFLALALIAGVAVIAEVRQRTAADRRTPSQTELDLIPAG